jgi:ABC-type branched-subunit amino acid transport system ATPase component/branched-subunit amino acid ABC-type transport system permease component
VNEFWNLVLSGLVTGAIYSIMASGLVLTYTTSGIFNFAHGAVAFATAYLYYQLNTGLGVPIVPAMILSAFIFAPVLGLLLDRILLRRLAKAPVYARIVGTIGLLVALPNLMQWLVVSVGNDVLNLGLKGNDAVTQGVPVAGIAFTPHHNYNIGGVVLNSDQIAVFIVAAFAAIVLWFVIRRTRAGLEMRAVVDREGLAALRGVNAARTSAVAWIMTMILAGLGGVLIAPLFQLQDFVFTLVVLGSLAAVVFGGLRSIPLAFAGGLLLGVVQNLVAGYSDRFLPNFLSNLSGLKSSVPFLLVILLLLWFGRERGRRAGSVADDVPRPDHRAGLPKWRRRLPWAVWTLILIAFSLQWIGSSWLQADTYDQTVIAQSLAMAVIFLSFVVLTGMTGQVSLMQASFVTAGGFAAGWALTHDWGSNVPLVFSHGQLNFFWALVIGGLAAAALGAVLALPLTRLGGVNFALGTLAWAFFLALVPWSVDSIRNGETGWTIRSPTLSIPGLNWLNDFMVHQLSSTGAVGHLSKLDFSQLPEQILMFLAIFGALTLGIHALMRSSTGRAILAMRSSEVAAESSGIAVNRAKVTVFALSAGIAGIGGVLLGQFSFSVTNSTAPPLVGLFWLALAVTFGIRRPGGALLAGFAFAAGTAVFHWISSDLLTGGDVNALITSVYFVPILSGLGAIQLAQEPDGILAFAGQRKLEKRRAQERDDRRKERIAAAEASVHDGIVPAHELEHTLGQPVGSNGERAPVVAAMDEPAKATGTAAAAKAAEGATFAINDVVAGYGDVEVLHGVDLRLEPGTITALLGPNGAGKSTVCSVAAGLLDPTLGQVLFRGEDITPLSPFRRARAGVLLVPEARGIFPGLSVEENLVLQVRDAGLRERAYDRFPILYERRGQPAGLLSGGEQQMLSLAPALADPPAVLIADEPTLGLAPLAAETVIEAVDELRSRGCAVLLVEEHARNALEIADLLAFMQLGNVVWSGPRVEADIELLTDAYLGSRA